MNFFLATDFQFYWCNCNLISGADFNRIFGFIRVCFLKLQPPTTSSASTYCRPYRLDYDFALKNIKFVSQHREAYFKLFSVIAFSTSSPFWLIHVCIFLAPSERKLFLSFDSSKRENIFFSRLNYSWFSRLSYEW